MSRQAHPDHFSVRAPVLDELDQKRLAELAKNCATVTSNIGLGSKLVGKNDFERHTKTSILMGINGSFKGYADGTDSAVYRPDPAASHIFQQIASVVDGKPTYVGDPSKTVVLEMTIESVASKAPAPIGVNFPNVVPTEKGTNGREYAFIILPEEHSSPNKVIRAQSNITREQLASIGALNVDTLLDGTLFFNGDDNTIVPVGCNLDNFLREHGKHIGIDFAAIDQSGHLTYKANQKTIGDAIDLAKSITNIPLDDMRKFEAVFERSDAMTWDVKEGIADNSTGASARMTNKYPVWIKVGFALQHV